MKKMSKTLMMSAIALTLVSSCKENQEVIPEATQETQVVETALVATAPLDAETPAFDEESERIADLPHPLGKSITNARTSSSGVTDYVNFNDKMALTIMPDHAKNTFALAPFYIQQVGNAWIHVKENSGPGYFPKFTSNYKHYHLSYENFVPCISNGQFGKPSGNKCLDFDPTEEPRTLDTHDGNEWIKIYAYDYDSPSRVFDLLGIQVTHGPIQLWFRKENGSWLHWSSLGVGTWDLSAYATDIKEILISGTGSTSIGFDNVKVKVPYL